MAQKKINYGAAPNDGTGDLYRVAMIKIDDNFTDLYTLVAELESSKVVKTTTLALTGGATAAATTLTGSAITLDVTDIDMSKASGTLAIGHGGTGVTTSTGTGANVQADSPALIGKPTAPLPAADAADGQVANVKYVKDGLSFKANSADVTAALAAKADKAAMDTALAAKANTSAVNSALALKVDKDGSKVLSDNNYTNDERVKLANIGDGASNDRSKHTGTQTLASISNAGSAAARNVQASPADATAGAVLTVGAFGLGGTAVILGAVDLNTEPLSGGLYYVQNAINGPGVNFNGWVRVEDVTPGAYTFHTAFDVIGNQWVRGRNGADWGAWRDIRDRATFIGGQPVSTITDLESRLDAALRVRLFSETSVQAFLTKIIALGAGYYRNSVPLPGIHPDSAGILALTADTFTFISASYQSGETLVISGNTSGVAAGIWQTQNLSGEMGTNANGTYIKHASGVMECWGRVILPLAHPSSSVTWAFPAVFTTVQSVLHCATENAESSGSQVGVSNVGKNGVFRSGLSNSYVGFTSYEYAEPLQQPVYLDVCAKGRWR